MHIPKTVEFLGYIPFECNYNDPIEKLRHFKLINGMSYKRWGEVMGRDPEQLTDWLSGRIRLCRKNIEFFEEFLKGINSELLHQRFN